MFPSHIFKAYDIRGLAPQELSRDVAYRVGQALVKYTKAKTVVVGCDMRSTTPELFAKLSEGVLSQGADVIDIGMVTTPMLYFAVAAYDAHDAGVMITASHNPKEYNGLKLCRGDVMPIGALTGMDKIRELAEAGPYPEKKRGTVIETSMSDAYLEKIFSLVDPEQINGLKVVLDGGNGMAGVIVPKIFERLHASHYPLYLEPDGEFPNHEANPLKEETLADLKEKVVEIGADVGFAFDGDGDRIGIVDEKGEVVRGDIITALLSTIVLSWDKGGTVLYDLRSSMAVPEEIALQNGRPLMCRVGHGYIKPQMVETNAVFAGELSNHFYFRDMACAESSDLVMLLVMRLISRTGKKLSELVAPLKRYAHSGEINFVVADPAAVIAKIESVYAHEATNITTIDGVRLDFGSANSPEQWWFSLRASNTEPLLRLNVEAKEKGVMEEKRDELRHLIEVYS